MTVSAANTHVRYHGDFSQCEKLRPSAFQLSAHVDNMMALGGIDSDVRTRRFQDGSKVRVLKGGGFTWIDIYATGGGGVYEVIDETKLVYDLYMDPVLYFDTATELRLDYDDPKCRNADQFSENQCYSQRLFERVEIAREQDGGALVFTPRDFTSYSDAGELTYDTKLFSKNMALNKVCYPANKTRSHGLHRCYSSWSKTLDGYTAHAILYYNSYVMMNMWCIAVDFGGKAYPFQAAPTSPISYHWPLGGYLDVVWCSNTDPYNTTPTYKCFDLWKEDVTEDSGEIVPHYFVSCIGDPDDYIQVWDLTTGEYQPITLHTAYDYAPEGFPGGKDGWRSRHIRHIGLVKRTLYWAQQDHYYGVPSGASGTIHWENDTQYGEINLGGTECGIQFAILNEFAQEIEWMDDIACQICNDDERLYDFWLYHCEAFREVNGVRLWTGPCTMANNNNCVYSVGDYSWDYGSNCTPSDTGNPDSGTISDYVLENYSSRYECEQSGLNAGDKNYGASTVAVRREVRAVTAPVCAHAQCGYWQGNYTCAHVTYEDWKYSDRVLSGSVLPIGLGVEYEITTLDGELLECNDSEFEDIDTVVSTTTEVVTSSYNSGFAQSTWPFYPTFAIMVSGETCNKPILTEKRKFTKPGDQFIDGIRIKPTEEFIEENCRFSMGGDNYSIVLDNNGLLHDSRGNTFHRNFETEDVGLFFLSQRKVKTRRVVE